MDEDFNIDGLTAMNYPTLGKRQAVYNSNTSPSMGSTTGSSMGSGFAGYSSVGSKGYEELMQQIRNLKSTLLRAVPMMSVCPLTGDLIIKLDNTLRISDEQLKKCIGPNDMIREDLLKVFDVQVQAMRHELEKSKIYLDM